MRSAGRTAYEAFHQSGHWESDSEINHEAWHRVGLALLHHYGYQTYEKLYAPVPLLLACPMCGLRHIDKGEFATKPHHTHACQGCGMVWRPAIVHTVGVEFLPGFKDEEAKP